MSEVYVVATLNDGSVAHVAFQTEGRFPSQPKGGWRPKADGLTWERNASDANIEYELARIAQMLAVPEKDRDGNILKPGRVLSGWRRITQSEHEQFERDRAYRAALVDRNGKIEHDIVKARQCHRDKLRHERANAMPLLDADWMRAAGQGKDTGAVEAERQKWRDAPADPRIEAAQTVEELKQITVG